MDLIDRAIAALETGVPVVTVNTRLARSIRGAYHERQSGRGRRLWASPSIMPWAAWLVRCWEEAIAGGVRDVPVRLQPFAEVLHWEEIIGAGGGSGVSSEAVAGLAASAWRQAQMWRVPLDSDEFSATDDTLAFQGWAREFQARLDRENRVEEARLADVVAGCFRSGAIPVPARLCLAGFDELTPQQRDVIAALAAAGCEVSHVAAIAEQPQATVVRCADREDEIRFAATWARSILERSPQAKIAIVIPSLGEIRGRVERVFLETFHPDVLTGGGSPRVSAFHLSEGRPLASIAVVRVALLALKFFEGRISLEEAGELLLSPYLKGAEKGFYARARVDYALRARGEMVIDPGRMVEAAVSNRARRLAARLERALRKAAKAPQRQSPSAWARTFSGFLKRLGWPGGAKLDSSEYQALDRWKDALSVLAALDSVRPVTSGSEALRLLRRIAENTAFQLADEGSPVQVMSLGEASGIDASHILVSGLHDGAWPPPARPHPLLPLSLQRRLGLPGGSPENSLERARAVTERWLTTGVETVFTYPAAEGEAELHCSPLLAKIPERDSAHSQSRYETWREVMARAAAREDFEPGRASPIAEGKTAGGGASLLRSQAACPFQAFGRYRLHARDFPSASFGMAEITRGTILHRALDYCWREMATSAALQAMEEERLREVVRHSARRAMEETRTGMEGEWEDKLRAVEAAVLEPLLMDWFALERRRSRDFTVAGAEQPMELELGGLHLRLRADRVDEVEGVGKVIIDYKLRSQPLSSKAWEGERPDEPQLPLYAIAAQEPPAALAFGLFSKGEVRFAGLSRDPDVLPGVAEWGTGGEELTWEEKIESWRSVLGALASSFREGHAAVDPKRGEVTCATCGLTPLCRVHEIPHTGLENGDE